MRNVAREQPTGVQFRVPGLTASNGNAGNAKTYRMANFLGLTRKMGVNINAKHVANIAKAARLRPPKTSSRSHLLTAKEEK